MTIRDAAAVTICSAALVTAFFVPATAAGTVFYVDGNGADSASGNALSPVRTIGAAATRARAGDLVVVRPGTYPESIVLTESGEPGAPIVFRGLPGALLVNPDPSQSQSAFDVGANAYITVQGFEISGGFDEAVFVRPGAHDVELSGLHVHDNQSGMWLDGATHVFVHDCVLDHNRRTGIRIFDGAHDIRIADTRSEANDDGEGCDGASDGFNADASTSDLTFERAAAVRNSDDGFDLKGTHVTILASVAQDNRCTGVKLWAGGTLENVLVERSATGIKVTAPAGAVTLMENCTLGQNDIGLAVAGSGHTVQLRNSIIAGPGKALTYDASVTLLEDHNILYRPSSAARLIVRQDETGDTLYSGDDINSGTWQHDSGQGTGTVARDPSFQPNSCRPAPSSLAIDSGDDVDSPALDLTGVQRPVGAAVDRGAFEWTPLIPTLVVRHLMVHPDRTGNGSIRIHAEVDLLGMRFDPLQDPVTISVRGPRGDALGGCPPFAAWNHRMAAGNARVRLARQQSAACMTSVTLRVYPDRVVVSVSARGADLWVLDGNDATVTIDLGHVRATTVAP